MIRRFAGLAMVASLAGCQDEQREPRARPICTQNCTPSGVVVGAGPGAGAGGGAGAGAGGGDGLKGTVHLVVDEAFSQTQPFAGQAKIYAPAEAAKPVSVDYGGPAGTSFSLDAEPGPLWVLVADDVASAPLVYSSLTAQVAPDASVLLPVVDPAVLAGIASKLSAGAVAEDKGHVYLEIQRSGAALAEVSVLGAAGNATIAYDTGAPGGYSDQAPSTGAAGRIVLLNVDAPDDPGTLQITLQDPDGVTIPIPLVVRKNTVTIAGYEI